MIKSFTTTLFFIVGMLFLLVGQAAAQVVVGGTVYDITKKTPIEAVSVLSTSGKGTTTDSLGRYSLLVSETDSIYFSYLNKLTPKYAVTSIANLGSFDISIMRRVNELPNVFVKQRNYRLDSIQNRDDYAKIFNYRKPGIRTSTNSTPGSFGVGLDLGELINMFRFKRNRSMLAFQQRLITEEQDKYIDHRFSKALVRKLTSFNGADLDTFMKAFRPTYDMVQQLNDLELGQFIVDAAKYYMDKKPVGSLKLNEE